MVGIASIMPLIAVMVDPAGVANNRLLSTLLGALGSSGATPSVHIIGFITITLIICTNVASLVLSWISVKFSAQLAAALSEQFAYALFRKLVEYFLAHPAAETCTGNVQRSSEIRIRWRVATRFCGCTRDPACADVYRCCCSLYRHCSRSSSCPSLGRSTH